MNGGRHAITKDLTIEAYDQICRDIRNQPKWRVDSDTDCDYYDGAQISVDVNQRLKDAGIPPQDSNLIKPTINAVLGIEAKSRTDYKITSDDERQNDLAEGLSAKIKEIESESRADRAMSDAYSSMIRSGLGWIEISREFNPVKYPYRVREVHRNEIHWDWTAKEPDLSDARYLRRDKWLDREQALASFPDERELIENSWSGWNSLDVYDGTDTRMARAYEIEQTWGRQQDDYLNHSSGMVRLTELWYRHFEQSYVLILPDGRGVEYREDNPYHQQALEQGVVQVQKSLLSRTRLSIWLGPHKLMDMPSPLPHQDFPYIPFWCFRKDRSRTPYGLIRDMRGPQDQILDLDILLYEILNSKRVEIDNDALDLSQNTYEDVAHNIASPRSLTVLNSQRRNADGFKVTTDNALAAAVFQLVGQRENRIESVSGIYRAMLGKGTQASSGVAINSLVEQGSTVLAEPNDNFRYARRLAGQQILSFAISDMVGKPSQIAVRQGSKKKMVYFNREVITPDGPVIENDIAAAQVKVVLEDIPATPSYRAQQLVSFTQMVQTAPPAYQAVLYPAMVELSDIPNRHELADQLRKVGNVPGPSTPEEEAQQAQQQQAIQMKMVELEIALKEAQVLKTRAEAAKLATPEGGDGQEQGAVAMGKLQAMEAELQSMQKVMALQAQVAQLKGQLSDKGGELNLKARDLDIKEESIGINARLKAEEIVSRLSTKNEPARAV